MSNSLIEYGANITYIGSIGYPDVHSVFKDMADKCRVYSITRPGHTDAVEFEDGKVMIGKIETLKNVTWENIKESVGVDQLKDLMQEANLLGLVNWTMVPYMNGIWEGIVEEILPGVDQDFKDRIAFFDLADPEKRTDEDIKQALKDIEKFNSHFKVILGLNKKEAIEIAQVLELNVEGDSPDEVDLKELTTSIGEELNIHCLVVHPVDEAAAYSEGVYYHTEGPYTSNPKLTTGAGDNFNAGFCIGQCLGLSVQQSLVTGAANSGFYVREARSPGKEELLGFLEKWSSDDI